MTSPVISCNQVSVTYGRDLALSHVTAKYSSGLHYIAGPNGAGKSTLLKTLAGLVKPTSGHVDITHGVQKTLVHQTDPVTRCQLFSYVPDIHPPAFALTVYELIQLGFQASIFNVSHEISDLVTRIANMFSLNHHGLKKVDELSLGQLKLAHLARAYAQDALTIVLDEPWSCLDIATSVQVVKILKAHCTEHKRAVFFTSHDFLFGTYFCDSITLLNQGRLIITGQKNDLITSNEFKSHIEQFMGFKFFEAQLSTSIFSQF